MPQLPTIVIITTTINVITNAIVIIISDVKSITKATVLRDLIQIMKHFIIGLKLIISALSYSKCNKQF